MEMILKWLASNQILAWVTTAILTIGGIGALLKKYIPVVRRYIKITKEGIDVIDALCDALEDGEVNKEEVAKVLKEAAEFKASLK